MAQFDVHRLASRPGLVIDCQSDLLGHMDSRLVVPLRPRAAMPPVATRLNPLFLIDGKEHMMVTQSAGAIRLTELAEAIASLDDRRDEIINALDFLITGV